MNTEKLKVIGKKFKEALPDMLLRNKKKPVYNERQIFQNNYQTTKNDFIKEMNEFKNSGKEIRSDISSINPGKQVESRTDWGITEEGISFKRETTKVDDKLEYKKYQILKSGDDRFQQIDIQLGVSTHINMINEDKNGKFFNRHEEGDINNFEQLTSKIDSFINQSSN